MMYTLEAKYTAMFALLARAPHTRWRVRRETRDEADLAWVLRDTVERAETAVSSRH